MDTAGVTPRRGGAGVPLTTIAFVAVLILFWCVQGIGALDRAWEHDFLNIYTGSQLATYVSSTDRSVIELAQMVGNIDLVYEAVGASSLALEVAQVLGVNGVFIFTGVPGRKEPIPVDTDLLMRNMVLKNQVIFGTVNAGRDAFEAAIRDLEVFKQRWPDAVGALFTNRLTIDMAPAKLRDGKGSIKDVIAYA
jgi:threonine dehydrogenase-like Zn-dependent dehydrogenase